MVVERGGQGRGGENRVELASVGQAEIVGVGTGFPQAGLVVAEAFQLEAEDPLVAVGVGLGDGLDAVGLVDQSAAGELAHGGRGEGRARGVGGGVVADGRAGDAVEPSGQERPAGDGRHRGTDAVEHVAIYRPGHGRRGDDGGCEEHRAAARGGVGIVASDTDEGVADCVGHGLVIHRAARCTADHIADVGRDSAGWHRIGRRRAVVGLVGPESVAVTVAGEPQDRLAILDGIGAELVAVEQADAFRKQAGGFHHGVAVDGRFG